MLVCGLLALAMGRGGRPVAAQLARPYYSVTDLGFHKVVTDSDFELKINNLDQVAGTARDWPFIQNPGAAWISASTLGLAESTQPSAINDAGQVVWNGRLVNEQQVHDHAYAILSEGTNALDLGLGDQSVAADINEAGQVAATYWASNGHRQACIWQRGRGATDLESHGAWSTAEGVNNLGDVCGATHWNDGLWHATLWRNGKPVDLGTYGGDTIARKINDAGQVLLVAEVVPWNTYLWEAGQVTALDPAGMGAQALGFNSSGQVVGIHRLRTAIIDYGFLWQHGTMYELNSLISSKAGWVVGWANDINDNGEIIALATRTNDQSVHRVLLRPAIPDFSPPVLSGPAASPAVVPAGGGTLTLSVHAMDNVGVTNASAAITGPGGRQAAVKLNETAPGDPKGGDWTGTLQVDSTWPSGQYTLQFAATDDAGNAAAPVSAAFTRDAAPPLLSKPSAIIGTEGKVYLSMYATDDLGVAAASATVIRGGGATLTMALTGADGGDPKNEVWSGSFQTDASWGAGTYTVRFDASDGAGNAASPVRATFMVVGFEAQVKRSDESAGVFAGDLQTFGVNDTIDGRAVAPDGALSVAPNLRWTLLEGTRIVKSGIGSSFNRLRISAAGPDWRVVFYSDSNENKRQDSGEPASVVAFGSQPYVTQYLSFAHHVDVTGVTQKAIDEMLSKASLLVQQRNELDDRRCPVVFRRTGRLGVFGTAGSPPGTPPSVVGPDDFVTVWQVRTANVKIVDLLYSGTTRGAGATKVIDDSADIILVREAATGDGATLAHEFGHSRGLEHPSAGGFAPSDLPHRLMEWGSRAGLPTDRLVSQECDYFRSAVPIKKGVVYLD